MKYNAEEIRISLPDFIMGNISDAGEIEKIEWEIQNNEFIKKEYEELKESMFFIKSLKLKEPPVNYFNNILPRLNKAIEEKKGAKQNILSFLKLKKYYWYLVPLIPVILIFLVYGIYFNGFKSYDNPISILNENNTNLKSIDSGLIKNETGNNLTIPSGEIEDTMVKNKSTSDGNDIMIERFTGNIIDNNNNNIDNTEDFGADNFETSDVFSKEEDDFNNLQSQFNQLDDDSQNDILDNLKNEKL